MKFWARLYNYNKTQGDKQVGKFREWLKENKNTTLESLLQVQEDRTSPWNLSKLYPAGYKAAQHNDAYWASVAPSNIMGMLAKDKKMVDASGGVKGQFEPIKKSPMGKKKKKRKS